VGRRRASSAATAWIDGSDAKLSANPAPREARPRAGGRWTAGDATWRPG